MSYFTVKISRDISLLEWLKAMHIAKNRINYLIDNHLCYVSDQVVNRNTILKKGEYLFIDTSYYETNNTIKDINIKIDIIYEDDYIIVVNKLANYLVYCDDENITTIIDIVRSYLYKHGKSTFIYPAHRLDIETSGCLIFCKDIITLAYFSYMFEEKSINKTYLAIVEGKTKKHSIITSPIGKNRHINNKMVVCKNGKAAYTEFETLKTFKDYSLLRIKIKTGRTHQIRVHLASINHPIVGDKLYGSKVELKSFMLHCERINFFYPYIEKEIEVVSKIPIAMSNFAN